MIFWEQEVASSNPVTPISHLLVNQSRAAASPPSALTRMGRSPEVSNTLITCTGTPPQDG